MTFTTRTIGTLGAALLAVALPAVAPAQAKSDFTKPLGIVQNLGATVPKDAVFLDATGTKRTFGSVLQGRPVLVVPFPLKRSAGCGVAIDGLQKVLFRAQNPNERKLFQKEGRNLLRVGQEFDVVLLSLDPGERPTDAAETKIDFQTKLGYTAEPVTALTGDQANILKVANALGFHYYYNGATKALRNPTGSVLLTPDGRISAYTIGNDFPTKVLEANVEIAQKGGIGEKVDDSLMFACVQLDAGVIERRGKIEAIVTGFALLTLAIVVYWIGSMLRDERKQNRNPLGGQPGA